MGTSNNIIQGAATVYLNGVDLGYTVGGAVVRNEPEYSEVKADQAVGTVKMFRTDENMTITINIAEISLEALRVAWGIPTANYSAGYYYMGYSDSCTVNTHTLRLVGKSPGCGSREFFFYSVVASNPTEYAMQRDNPTILEVQFKALKSSSNSNYFGYVRDF